MHDVDVYERFPSIVVRDLKGVASIIRALFERLPRRTISVQALSEDWCREHERDAGKH